MAEQFRIAIVGAGPAGLSAALRAAELGVDHVLLEAAPGIADTLRHFPKGKQVMAEPLRLPLRSGLPFGAATREQLLDDWSRAVAGQSVNLRTGAALTAVTGVAGAFRLTLASGQEIEAGAVVLAMGVQGNLRRLDVPGDTLPGVQYELADPEAYGGETIVVVGGGDSGVENALALAGRNRVILVNRHEEFTACREANFNRLTEALAAGQLEVRSGTSVLGVDAVPGALPLAIQLQSMQGKERIACHRIIARLGTLPPRRVLEGFGVAFPADAAATVPQLSTHYESSRPGLYVVGALAGYPLIKQALNQGYEVVDHLLGRPIEAVDEGLLADKLRRIPGVAAVDAGIDLIFRCQPLLASLTRLQLREYLLESEIHVPAAGTAIFHQNDYGNSFFAILRGTAEVQVARDGGATAVFPLQAGNYFGEMGLLSGRRRSATVLAGEGCVLVETPQRAMLKLLAAAPGVQAQLDRVSLKRLLRNGFGASLPEDELDAVVNGATLQRFAAGETIFGEGDAADGVYVIQRGSVTIAQQAGTQEQVLAYLSAGNYFGEMAFLAQRKRAATVRAAAPTEVACVPATAFAGLLEANPQVRAEIVRRYLDRVRANHSRDGGRNGEFVNFLMRQGVGEATDVLLIDYARCIRCNACEAACAEAHEGCSRLDREAGQTFNTLHIPASCRHCEQPGCMKDCPANAIHRSAGGEVYIDDNCIGCGQCQRNCPYGVIRLADVAPPRPAAGFLARFFGGGPRSVAEDAAAPRRKAVKCDMCLGVAGGAACVRACPTGAAFRASPERFLAHPAP